MMQEHVTLESKGQMVSGFVHRPAGDGPWPAVLLFHGFMAAKSQPPHRLFVQLAEALVQAGTVSLRIDFRGRGDSEGETIDITPAGDLNDAQVALDFLARQAYVDPQRLAVLGISWGGAIAACLTGRDERVRATVMWSSIPGGPADWRPELRQVNGRLAAEFVGNLVGQQFYEGLQEINPLQALLQAKRPLLLVYGSQDEVVPQAEVTAAKAALVEAGAPHDVVVIEGADHVFMGHTWARAVVEQTVAWLQAQL
jgi:dienelactone hydrolase